MCTENSAQRSNHSTRQGKLLVVGIGPGGKDDRTYRAVNAIESAEVIVGYNKYIDLISDLIANKKTISTGMTQERKRVENAINEATAGYTVALVSSGDPGVYGMAGLALEMMQEMQLNIPVEIIPGITAANSAAARLGAPLMLDYCCISLSDLMIPWDMIVKRLHGAGQGDFTVALYNPRSHKRVFQLEQAVQILSQYRPITTPVGIVHSIGLPAEHIEHTTLGDLLSLKIHMRSLVIIGNSTSTFYSSWMLTPRGYFESDLE